MKIAIRILALCLIAAAAVVGNSLPKNTNMAAIHQGTVPGPTPYCNPFTEKCPNMR